MHRAVYSCSGKISITPATCDRGHGNAQVRSDDAVGATTREVPCIPLDDFAVGHPPPDVVKVDVEGAESEVLKGAEQLFGRGEPVLLCEVHDGEQRRAVEGWLDEHSYSWHWLEQDERWPRHRFAFPQQRRGT
ncbi:MAG: FkbM family methyltransferase [Firmicutes bacterium]|nr:FkbM family methyltransferase [Bacillota bacterium]